MFYFGYIIIESDGQEDSNKDTKERAVTEFCVILITIIRIPEKEQLLNFVLS